MKKNKMMRIASILMVVTLLSTCAISGTFAKYVTKAEGKDSARVAKFGVVVGIENADLFAQKYEKDDTTYKGQFTVEKDPENNVVEANYTELVAPGTKSKKAATATVFGTPEVAVRYALTIDGLKDVYLKAGKYTDYTELVATTDDEGVTTYGYTKTFELKNDYAPVKWDIAVSNEAGTKYILTELAKQYGVDVTGFAITEAAEIFKTYKTQLASLLESLVDGASNAQVNISDDGVITMSMDFDPNTEMDYTFALTWNWAFEKLDEEGVADPIVDAADTLLGNLQDPGFTYVAAEGAKTPVKGTDYNLALDVHFIATATQID
jgi:hypothetical protein